MAYILTRRSELQSGTSSRNRGRRRAGPRDDDDQCDLSRSIVAVVIYLTESRRDQELVARANADDELAAY